MYAVETEGLTRRFGDLVAVDGVSLQIKKGEMFGVLGPNGAGKTTLISMLVTMKKPTSGTARVNGFDISSEPGGVRASLGIVFQDPSLDEDLTAYENLELHAAMYGIERGRRKECIMEVIRTVELEDRLHDIVKTFSGGMRRRLEIARGLLHCPTVLFLDEPTLGLDPQTRKHVWDYIRKLRKERGITIVMTTHYMEEADSLCGRIAIIDRGRIIALDTPEALKDSLGGDMVAVKTPEPERLIKAVGRLAKKAKTSDGGASLSVEKAESAVMKIIEIARKNKIEVQSVGIHKPTLDDVFLHYTGRDIRAESGSAKDSMRIRRMAWGARR